MRLPLSSVPTNALFDWFESTRRVAPLSSWTKFQTQSLPPQFSAASNRTFRTGGRYLISPDGKIDSSAFLRAFCLNLQLNPKVGATFDSNFSSFLFADIIRPVAMAVSKSCVSFVFLRFCFCSCLSSSLTQSTN